MAQSYFLPGGVDYEDVREMLNAMKSDPSHPFRVMFDSIDPNVTITLVQMKDLEDGAKSVAWRITFNKEFEIEGHKSEPGSTHDFDATLRLKGNDWLIDNF